MYEHTNVEAVESFITKSLLKGEDVAIPDFGHLVVKSLGDRRTVLFESTDVHSSYIRTISPAGENEKKEINALCTIISFPLKGGKVVSLPKVGVFQPIKRVKGKILVSFMLSSYLQNLLNKEKNKEKKKDTVKERIEYVYYNVDKVPDVRAGKNEIQKSKEVEIEEDNKIHVPERSRTLEIVEPIKQNDSDPFKHKTGLSNKQAIAQIGDQNVFQNDTDEKGRSMDLRKIFLFIAVVFVLTGSIVWIFYFRNNRKTVEGKAAISSESISLPTLAELHYGHAAFWVYIYEANKDKLSSPINISKNVSLIIPNLKTEYDVDLTDSLEIRRAMILADIILKEKIRKE